MNRASAGKGAKRQGTVSRRPGGGEKGGSIPEAPSDIFAARIDKWLFHARLYRSRALAQAAASAGKIRLNGVRVEKPAQGVKAGDILTLGRGREVLALRVLNVAERRGPAGQARLLYQILIE